MISKEEFKLECLRSTCILISGFRIEASLENIYDRTERLYQEGLKRNFLQTETDNRSFDKDGRVVNKDEL